MTQAEFGVLESGAFFAVPALLGVGLLLEAMYSKIFTYGLYAVVGLVGLKDLHIT